MKHTKITEINILGLQQDLKLSTPKQNNDPPPIQREPVPPPQEINITPQKERLNSILLDYFDDSIEKIQIKRKDIKKNYSATITRNTLMIIYNNDKQFNHQYNLQTGQVYIDNIPVSDEFVDTIINILLAIINDINQERATVVTE